MTNNNSPFQIGLEGGFNLFNSDVAHDILLGLCFHCLRLRNTEIPNDCQGLLQNLHQHASMKTLNVVATSNDSINFNSLFTSISFNQKKSVKSILGWCPLFRDNILYPNLFQLCGNWKIALGGNIDTMLLYNFHEVVMWAFHHVIEPPLTTSKSKQSLISGIYIHLFTLFSRAKSQDCFLPFQNPLLSVFHHGSVGFLQGFIERVYDGIDWHFVFLCFGFFLVAFD